MKGETLLEEQKKGATVIDVRVADQYKEGHIKDAINLPLETIEKDIASKVPKKDTKIVLYCNTGNRSGQAFEKLKKLGYTNVSTSARKEGTEQSVIEYNKEDYFIALKVAKELGITDMIENNDLSNKIGVTIK